MFKQKHAIYIIESTSGHFKIGVSTNPKRRLKQLGGTKTPYEYSLTYFWRMESRDQAIYVERYLHNCLRHHRVNGEWFVLTPQELIEIGNNLIDMGIDEYNLQKAGV